MISKFALKLSYYLAENGGHPEKQKIYAYGIECFFNELISDILLLFCGIILHQTLSLAIWCISFTLIRINLGGFHASTHARCISLGTVLGVISVYINSFWTITYPWSILVIMFFSLYIAIHHAPIVHKNHPVSDHQKKIAKNKAIFFILLEGIVGILFFSCFTSYIAPIFTGILTASMMAGAAILINNIPIQLPTK